MMPLELECISGESLIERWKIRPVDIVFMIMNHDLEATEHFGFGTGYFRSFDGSAFQRISGGTEPTNFMFWMEDIIRIESQYPVLINGPKDVWSINEIQNRWNLPEADVLHIIDQSGISPVDPTGKDIEFDERMQVLIYDRRIITDRDLLYRCSDIEQIENDNPALFVPPDSEPGYFDLMRQAKPEIESLYLIISDSSFFEHDPDRMKKTVLTHFVENESQYNLIKKTYLEDRSIYPFNVGQETRTFKGKLLQALLIDHGYGRKDYQKLFQEYKKLTD